MIVQTVIHRAARSACIAVLAVSGLTLSGVAGEAAAQTYGGYGYGQTQGYSQGYDYGHAGRYGRYRAPSYADQLDRPGDFRCDAYWDRGRSDCHEGWRDQRRHTGYGQGWSGQGWSGQNWRGQGGRYGQGYGRGYGQGPAYGQGGAVAYHGAYGRPDLVYGGGGYGGGGYGGHAPVAGRDPARVDWCRWNYRSYNPATGYYLAYSGRYVFCG